MTAGMPSRHASLQNACIMPRWDVEESPVLVGDNETSLGNSEVSSLDAGDVEEIGISPMCARCRTLAGSPSAHEMLGRYCLCMINRDIQREVLQGLRKADSHSSRSQRQGQFIYGKYGPTCHAPSRAEDSKGENGSLSRSSGNNEGGGQRAPSGGGSGGERPLSPAPSGKSSVGTTAGDPSGAPDGAYGSPRPSSPRARSDFPGVGVSGGQASTGLLPPGGSGNAREGFSPLQRGSSVAMLVDHGVPSSVPLSGGSGGGGGLRRARDRRADRRRKKDPLEALEERLLDGFNMESITRQLERQDETLLKGVSVSVRGLHAHELPSCSLGGTCVFLRRA